MTEPKEFEPIFCPSCGGKEIHIHFKTGMIRCATCEKWWWDMKDFELHLKGENK